MGRGCTERVQHVHSSSRFSVGGGSSSVLIGVSELISTVGDDARAALIRDEAVNF